MAKKLPLRMLLAHVATILEGPRDRLGRLDPAEAYGSQRERIREAEDAIRELAVNNCCTGSRDRMDQIAKVIRVHLGEPK